MDTPVEICYDINSKYRDLFMKTSSFNEYVVYYNEQFRHYIYTGEEILNRIENESYFYDKILNENITLKKYLEDYKIDSSESKSYILECVMFNRKN